MGTLVSKVRAVLSQSRVRCLFRTESKELSPGKHLLPTHPHSTPMGALSHKTWVLELPDPLLKVSLRAWCCRISGYEQSVSPLGWMETYVIEFRSLWAQHNSSPRDEGCETHSWTEAQKSKPTPKCKAATPACIFQVSHPSPGRDFGCVSFVGFFSLRFPVLGCSKCSRASTTSGFLSFQRNRNGRDICPRVQSQVSLSKSPKEQWSGKQAPLACHWYVNEWALLSWTGHLCALIPSEILDFWLRTNADLAPGRVPRHFLRSRHSFFFIGYSKHKRWEPESEIEEKLRFSKFISNWLTLEWVWTSSKFASSVKWVSRRAERIGWHNHERTGPKRRVDSLKSSCWCMSSWWHRMIKRTGFGVPILVSG